MTSEEQEDRTIYRIVVNAEEQYSIWPTDREVPLGWRRVGESGTKQNCLERIGKLWTDMRPLSLREAVQPTNRKKSRKTAPRK